MRCVSPVIHRFMPSVGNDGMTGRGSANLYRQVSYRTAGGCCVCSREMDDGGIKHYNMPKCFAMHFAMFPENVICIFIKNRNTIIKKAVFA